MPLEVPWPVSPPNYGSKSYEFVAQICCEDLPSKTWDGAGPSQGWLVFFREPEGFGESEPVAVIHVNELGPDRSPVVEQYDPMNGGLNYWPLKISDGEPLDDSQRERSNGNNEEIDYSPFDWPTAIEYLDTVCAELHRTYDRDPSEVEQSLQRSSAIGRTFWQRFVSSFGRYSRHYEERAKRRLYKTDSQGRLVKTVIVNGKAIDLYASSQYCRPKPSLIAEIETLVTARCPGEVSYLKLTRRYHQHRQAALLAIKSFPQRAREMQSTGQPFATSGQRLLNEFNSIEFYLNTSPTMHRMASVAKGSVQDIGQPRGYTDFVDRHVADLYKSSGLGLEDVPKPLLGGLLRSWSASGDKLGMQMGGIPQWDQTDGWGFFDDEERRNVISRGSSKRGPSGELDQTGIMHPENEHFDGDNVLLLKFPPNRLINSRHGTYYFIAARADVLRNDFSKVTCVVQSD